MITAAQIVDALLETGNTVVIRTINPNDLNGIEQVAFRVFGDKFSHEGLVGYVGQADPSVSYVAECDGKIVGFLLLRRLSLDKVFEDVDYAGNPSWSIEQVEDLHRYAGRNGVEGIALAVLPEYRGSRGVALRLLHEIANIGVDHVWFQAASSLNNFSFWLKRSRHVATAVGPSKVFIFVRDLA